MSIIKDRSKPFTPAPAGLHRAVAVDVVDLGWELDDFNGKMLPKIRIAWEIEEEMAGGGRFVVMSRYNVPVSLKSKKSSLVKDLISWRGRAFTDEELKSFELDNIIGAPCQLSIIHNVKDDKTYANVDAIVPAHKDGKLIPSGKYKRAKDRDDWQAPKVSAFDEFPKDKTAEPAPTEGETVGRTIDDHNDPLPF